MNSDSSITAFAPPQAEDTFDVTVVNPWGTSAVVSAGEITYTAASNLPTVTALNVTSGPTGGGTSVTLTGTHFTDVTHVAFGTATAPRHGGFVIMMEINGRYRALAVDEIVGIHDIVVKGLDIIVGRPVGISGSTILGVGRVIMILNPASLATISPFVNEPSAGGPGVGGSGAVGPDVGRPGANRP